MLAMMGLVGCKNNGNVDTTPESQKTDTVLVVDKRYSGYGSHICFLLVGKKDGKITNTYRKEYFAEPGAYPVADVGDTLVVKPIDQSGNIDIVKNLTMENKMKTFAKQR